MQVVVRATGELRFFLPGKKERAVFEVDGPLTVAQFVQRLGIPEGQLGIVGVGGRQVEPDYLIQNGDELEFFAPMDGG